MERPNDIDDVKNKIIPLSKDTPPIIDSLVALYQKELPYDYKLECAILEHIFTGTLPYEAFSHYMTSDVFYFKDHQNIYKTYILCINKYNKSDAVLMKKEWEANKISERNFVEIYSKITEKAKAINSLMLSQETLLSYIQILYELYLRRKYIYSNAYNLDKAFRSDEDIFNLYSKSITTYEKLINVGFKNSLIETSVNNAVDYILNNEKIGYFKLYDDKLASFIQLKPNRIVLFPSDKGAGKTSFISWIVEGLLECNDNIAILWFCFEDSVNEMIYKFISRKTRLSVKQLQGVDYELTETDKKKINDVATILKTKNIQFVDEICSVEEIKKYTKNFSEYFIKKNIVVIIDNFGLISKRGLTGDNIEKEKQMVEALNNLRKSTNSCILIPHHINKAATEKDNYNEGYRIRDNDVKGAGELLNYFPQCYSIIRPGKYTDVASAYESNRLNRKYTDKPSIKDFEKDIWAINPNGDIANAWVKLNIVLNSVTKDGDNNLIDYSYVVNRWREHINGMNRINNSRDERFRSKLTPFAEFIENKMYVKTNDTTSLPFDKFYYGKIKKRPHINRMFIVEAIRDRYSDFTDKDKAVFRYHHALEYNDFKPLYDEPNDN